MVPARPRLLLGFALCCLALFIMAGSVYRGQPVGRVALGAEAPVPASAAIVVLPDTQYYASTYPEILAAQTAWIAEAGRDRPIAAALQLGDIVDQAGDRAQWRAASAAFRRLDGRVPYLLVPGNHDTDRNRAGLMDEYFAPSSMPWLGGTMAAGHIENSYLVVDFGRRRWLILGIEFGPRDVALAWADGVLKSHASLPSILVTHAYLNSDGSRYGRPVPGHDDVKSSAQHFAPQVFAYTPEAGINDGEQIWQKLVLPNRNVQIVLCGHDSGAARLTSVRPDGSRVYQLLSDYQWLYQGSPDYAGGSGYLRILELDDDDRQVRVRTYSPYLGRYLTDAENEFAFMLDLPVASAENPT